MVRSVSEVNDDRAVKMLVRLLIAGWRLDFDKYNLQPAIVARALNYALSSGWVDRVAGELRVTAKGLNWLRANAIDKAFPWLDAPCEGRVAHGPVHDIRIIEWRALSSIRDSVSDRAT